MASVVTVIFSKDRPLQLDATLRSLQLHVSDTSSYRPFVLYKTSGPAYDAAYDVLRIQHPHARFHVEDDFKPDLLEIVEGARYVFFLVDDTLVTGHVPLERAVRLLDERADHLAFSFRLGRNTTYCYTKDEQQPPPPFTELGQGILSLDWTVADHDFGYPLEVSSSVYRASDMTPLLHTLDYENPNTLEGQLAMHSASFRSRSPSLACLERSVAFSVPANRVQTIWPNRASADESLTPSALLDRYVRGDRLDVASYRGFTPNACHQEVGFVWSRDLSVPAVSVVVDGKALERDGGALLAETLGQAFDDFEIVVAVSSGGGGAARVVSRLSREHAGSRIRMISPPAPGTARGLGHVIEACLGRYVALPGAAGMLRPMVLERSVRMLDADPGLGFIAMGARTLDAAVGWSEPGSEVAESHTLVRKHILRELLATTDVTTERGNQGAAWRFLERGINGVRLA